MKITLMRKERLRLNLTQQELGELVGLTMSAIGKIELGQRKPSYDVMLRLSDVLKIPGDKLLNIVDDSSFSQK